MNIINFTTYFGVVCSGLAIMLGVIGMILTSGPLSAIAIVLGALGVVLFFVTDYYFKRAS